MGSQRSKTKFKSAAVACAVALFLPNLAVADKLDDLFERLKLAEGPELTLTEEAIWLEWSTSGSPAMDLLLKKGRAAMENGEHALAIEHFTALIDHAPDFAEGYNARATAFFAQGAIGQSLADIRRTLVREPRHFGALMGLAIILDQMDKPRDALATYRMVEALHPRREGLQEEIDRLETQLGDQSL